MRVGKQTIFKMGAQWQEDGCKFPDNLSTSRFGLPKPQPSPKASRCCRHTPLRNICHKGQPQLGQRRTEGRRCQFNEDGLTKRLLSFLIHLAICSLDLAANQEQTGNVCQRTAISSLSLTQKNPGLQKCQHVGHSKT